AFGELDHGEIAPVRLADAGLGHAEPDAGHREQGFGLRGLQIDSHADLREVRAAGKSLRASMDARMIADSPPLIVPRLLPARWPPRQPYRNAYRVRCDRGAGRVPLCLRRLTRAAGPMPGTCAAAGVTKWISFARSPQPATSGPSDKFPFRPALMNSGLNLAFLLSGRGVVPRPTQSVEEAMKRTMIASAIALAFGFATPAMAN